MVDDERNDFVAGVMVALALVPGAAIGGMAPALGDVDLAVRGGPPLGVDAACVLVAGGMTLGLKRLTLHRRHVED